jgi:hypothetical protein
LAFGTFFEEDFDENHNSEQHLNCSIMAGIKRRQADDTEEVETKKLKTTTKADKKFNLKMARKDAKSEKKSKPIEQISEPKGKENEENTVEDPFVLKEKKGKVEKKEPRPEKKELEEVKAEKKAPKAEKKESKPKEKPEKPGKKLKLMEVESKLTKDFGKDKSFAKTKVDKKEKARKKNPKEAPDSDDLVQSDTSEEENGFYGFSAAEDPVNAETGSVASDGDDADEEEEDEEPDGDGNPAKMAKINGHAPISVTSMERSLNYPSRIR